MAWMPGEDLIIRLWDTVEKVGSGLAKPMQIKREGRALTEVRRHEMLADAQTRVDVERILSGEAALGDGGKLLLSHAGKANERNEPYLSFQPSEPSSGGTRILTEFAADRETAVAMRKLLNLRKTVVLAEEEMTQNTGREQENVCSAEANKSSVEEDWLERWREGAESVSAEAMQRLWARALAGEIISPGSYSLRSLNFLRTLGRNEAGLIAEFGAYVLSGVYVFSESTTFKTAFSFDKQLELQAMGIISGVESVGLTRSANLTPNDGKYKHGIIHAGSAIIAVSDTEKIIRIPCLSVTTLGREILKLGKFEGNDDYVRDLVDFLKPHCSEILIGTIVSLEGGRVTTATPRCVYPM